MAARFLISSIGVFDTIASASQVPGWLLAMIGGPFWGIFLPGYR